MDERDKNMPHRILKSSLNPDESITIVKETDDTMSHEYRLYVESDGVLLLDREELINLRNMIDELL